MASVVNPSSGSVLKEMQLIFGNAQETRACHVKCVKKMFMLYKKTQTNMFYKHFERILAKIFSMEPINNPANVNLLQFVSKFCVDIAKHAESEEESQDFLANVINTTLKFAQSIYFQQANHALKLLALILQGIPNSIELDFDLCDTIQNVLLKRLNEPRVKLIPLILAVLVRLQMPHEANCPVIAAYIAALQDRNPKIRLEALKAVAPCAASIPNIKERIRDINDLVRTAAFEKCADIGPKRFTIGDKREIIMLGFQEKYPPARKIFIEYLLPNWLTAFGGSFFEFFKGIKYDACEEDFIIMQYLCENIVEVFFKSQPVEDLIGKIPLTEEKLVKIEELTTEIAPYWNVLASILRKSEICDEYVERILPELTPFCKYIEDFIAVKSKEKLDEFEFLEYQFLLKNLLDIVEQYDFSDEVGRRATYSLAISLLQNELLCTSIYKKLVLLASQVQSDINLFISDICQVVSHIYKSTQRAPLTESERLNHDFKVAELRIKLNILKEEESIAIEKQDFERANSFKIEVETCSKSLKELLAQNIQQNGYNPMTICRCLDILTGLLEHSSVVKMTPALKTCHDEFFIKQITSKNSEVHWRVLRCLSLFMLIDKSVMQEYLQIVSVPILTYRITTDPNIQAIVESIRGLTDIYRFYGENVFNANDDDNGTKRRLYKSDEDTSKSQNSSDSNEVMITMPYFIGVLVDMIDDESDDIRHAAGLHILYLVTYTQINVTASLFTRILLKWYNPLTEKEDPRLLRYLGLLIQRCTNKKSSKGVIKESFFLTISTLMNAPRGSPLADVDLDNVMSFFAALINIHEHGDDLYIFAIDVCIKIFEDLTDRSVPLLIKILKRLELSDNNNDLSRELVSRIEELIKEIPTRTSKKLLTQLLQKLKQNNKTDAEVVENISQDTQSSQDKTNDTAEELENSQHNRRDHRSNGKLPVVLLEQMNFTKIAQQNTNLKLPTVIDDLEMMQLDDSDMSSRINGALNTSDSSQNSSQITDECNTSGSSTNIRRSTKKRRRSLNIIL